MVGNYILKPHIIFLHLLCPLFDWLPSSSLDCAELLVSFGPTLPQIMKYWDVLDTLVLVQVHALEPGE